MDPAFKRGCVVGAASVTAVVLFLNWKKERSRKSKPSKFSHPRQWAVWLRLDQKKKGVVTREDVKNLCKRFHSREHIPILLGALDPDGKDHISFEKFIHEFHYVATMRKAARLKLWHRTCGIGVAGNVAGHMSQAGEAGADSKAATMPAALFMYYVPQPAYTASDQEAISTRLNEFPVTYAAIDYPALPTAHNVQVEPELGLLCDIVYSADRKKVDHLVPRRVAAFNDCSIRAMEGASKLSQKKNWGFGSKGISVRSFEVDSIKKGTWIDNLVIASWLKRDGIIHQYSVNAPVRNYLCFHDDLLAWIVKSINEQQDTDKWETMFPQLVEGDYPTSTWIACGAGEYTEWGATNYLQKADECSIFLYDESVLPDGPSMEVVELSFDDYELPEGLVNLHQTFV